MNIPVSSFNDSSERRSSLIQSLSDFSKQHRAAQLDRVLRQLSRGHISRRSSWDCAQQPPVHLGT